MQTQWSSAGNEEDGGVGVGSAPAPPGVAVDAGVEAAGIPAAVTSVDEPVATDAGSDEVLGTAPADDTDATEGEEEAHRSAVDAVDELLDEVELALARLDDGTYGRCEACGAPIDDARLADSPLERTCGTCVTEGPGGVDPVDGAPDAVGATMPAVAPVGLAATTGPHGG